MWRKILKIFIDVPINTDNNLIDVFDDIDESMRFRRKNLIDRQSVFYNNKVL